jgi:hypothetical protein
VVKLHNVKLVLFIPLKTAMQQFTIFRITPLPLKIGKDSYVIYKLEYTHFALADGRRDYALLDEVNLLHCIVTNVATVCPVSTAVYEARTLTCVSSLYFQTPVEITPCRRTVLVNHTAPMLERYGAVWVYNFPQSTMVTVRCPMDDGSWETVTEMLQGPGSITDATACHITSNWI